MMNCEEKRVWMFVQLNNHLKWHKETTNQGGLLTLSVYF